MAPDKDLRIYAQTRDERAFERLAERYSGLVYGSALARTGSPETAEEIVQNVFVKLAQRAQKLQDHPTLAGWLYKVTGNESASYLRRESKRRQRMNDYQKHQIWKEESPEIEPEHLPHLYESLDNLPDPDRTLLLRRFFYEESYHEIGQALGKSEAASRKQAERALTKLSRLMNKRGVVINTVVLTGALSSQFAKVAPASAVAAASQSSAIAMVGTQTGGWSALVQALALPPAKLVWFGTALMWLTVGSAGFIAGRDQVPSSPPPEVAAAPFATPNDVTQPTSAIPNHRVFQEPTMERLRFLIRSTKAEHRLLEFRLAVRNLNAHQLTELTNYARENLVYADDEDRAIMTALLSHLVVHDAQSALVFAEDLGSWKSDILPEVIAAWAMTDRENALEWIQSAGASIRSKAFAAVLEKIGDRDRVDALSLFRNEVAEGTVSASSWNPDDFFREWVKEDPHTAMREAVDLRSLTKRNQSAERALAAWGRLDPDAAKSWLHTHGDGLEEVFRNELTVSLIDGWAETAPTEAAQYLLEVDPPNTQERAAHFLLRDWSATSFEEASGWIDSVEDPWRRHLFEYILMVATRDYGNREEAIAYGIEKFETHSGMFHALYLQSDEIVREDPVAAMDWMESFSKGMLTEGMHSTLLGVAFNEMRWTIPEETHKHLDRIPSANDRQKHYELAARSWAHEDLAAARDWANELPDSAERDRALAGVTSAWIDQAPNEAADWIRGLDSGETRDRLAQRYVNKNAHQDVRGAIELASSIEHDPFRREQAVETAMRAWLSQEPAVARAAINQSDLLSETIKWRLLGE